MITRPVKARQIYRPLDYVTTLRVFVLDRPPWLNTEIPGRYGDLWRRIEYIAAVFICDVSLERAQK